MRILLTGGGTGGHIIPILAVIRRLNDREPENLELLYIGSGEGVEQTIVENHEIPYTSVMSGKIRRYFSLKTIVDLGIKLPLGVLQALWKVWRFMPDAVISKGGYGAIPVVIAAWLYRIPIIVHESDIIPGIANKWSARFARIIALSFEGAAEKFKNTKASILVTGNPIREEMLQGTLEEAQAFFGMQDSAPTLLVVGGSQGAQRLNTAIINMLPTLTKTMHVIHVAGENNIAEAKEQVELMGSAIVAGRYHLYDFLNAEMNLAYSAANIILTRAGAGTLNEIASRGIPSIIVPLDNSASDHQRANAYYYAERGAAVVVEENNLQENIIVEQIQTILGDTEKYRAMSESALALAEPHAADHLAEIAIRLVKEGQ